MLDSPKNIVGNHWLIKLEEDRLSYSPSAIARILKLINYELGVSVKVDRSKFIYERERTATNSYVCIKISSIQGKRLYFRNLSTQKTV